MDIILAALHGADAVRQLLYVLIVGICVGIVWWLGTKAIVSLKAPPPTATVWNYLFLLIMCIAAINFLLGLIGHSFIQW